MFRVAALPFVALVALSAITPSGAATIAQNYNGTNIPGGSNYFLGQSFTVEGAGQFNNVELSFYTGYGASIPYADGALFLYASPFAGTVSQLGTGSNFLGSTVGANRAFSFGTSLVLTGGTKYYAYLNDVSPSTQFGGGNPYAGGEGIQADSGTGYRFNALPSLDLRFGAGGSPTTLSAVPEPASWAMLLVGFGAIGGALRSRRQIVLSIG